MGRGEKQKFMCMMLEIFTRSIKHKTKIFNKRKHDNDNDNDDDNDGVKFMKVIHPTVL